MSTNPQPAPLTPPPGMVPAGVPWYRSNGFKMNVGTSASLVLGWLVAQIGTHGIWVPASDAVTAGFTFASWDYTAVVISLLTNAALLVHNWMNPGVVAPFSIFNQANPKVSSP